MFLPHHHRFLAVVIYAYIAWQFLTLGAACASAGVYLSLNAHIEAALLVPIGTMLLQVGVVAVEQLRDALNGNGIGY